MKKLRNKNMKRQMLFIVLALFSTFLLVINFIPTFTINAGLTTEFTFGLSSEDIAYVNQSDPNMNYYNPYGWGLIGNSCEIYMYFDLERLPKENGQLYFTFFMYLFTDFIYPPDYIDYVEINIISIEESWNVSEITWNNKPNHGEIINTVNISDIDQEGPFIQYYNFQKAVDITNFYNISKPGELSFCINLTKNNEKLNTSVYFTPRLLWNYEIVILSYTNIISTFIIISILIGTIYFLRKDIYRCPNCGAKKVHNEIKCYACETTFERALRIKRSDYQLVLNLLWVFIFFEVLYLIISTCFQIGYTYILIFLIPILWIILNFIILYYRILKKKPRLYKKVKL